MPFSTSAHPATPSVCPEARRGDGVLAAAHQPVLSTRGTSVNKTDNPHPWGLKATSKSVNLRLQRSMPWGSCHTMVVQERGQFGVDAGEKYTPPPHPWSFMLP